MHSKTIVNRVELQFPLRGSSVLLTSDIFSLWFFFPVIFVFFFFFLSFSFLLILQFAEGQGEKSSTS